MAEAKRGCLGWATSWGNGIWFYSLDRCCRFIRGQKSTPTKTTKTHPKPRPSSSPVGGHFCGRSEAGMSRLGVGWGNGIRLCSLDRCCRSIRGQKSAPTKPHPKPRPSSLPVGGHFCGRSEAGVSRLGVGWGNGIWFCSLERCCRFIRGQKSAPTKTTKTHPKPRPSSHLWEATSVAEAKRGCLGWATSWGDGIWFCSLDWCCRSIRGQKSAPTKPHPKPHPKPRPSSSPVGGHFCGRSGAGVFRSGHKLGQRYLVLLFGAVLPLHSRTEVRSHQNHQNPHQTPTVILTCGRPLLWPKRSWGVSVGRRLGQRYLVLLFGAVLPLHSRTEVRSHQNHQNRSPFHPNCTLRLLKFPY